MSNAQQPEDQLTLEQIRAIFLRNRGSVGEFATRIGKSKTAVSMVLNGKTTSKPMVHEARKFAMELQRREIVERAALAKDLNGESARTYVERLKRKEDNSSTNSSSATE